MRFFKLLHKTLFLIKKIPKIGIQGNNLHIFPWHLQDQKHFPKKSSITQLSTPKKIDAYISSKSKTIIPTIPIFNYF